MSVQVRLLGKTEVSLGSEAVHLAPFQAALVTLVYATGGISRPAIARILWETELDSAVRHRLRQLLSATRRRVGAPLFETAGDTVSPAAVSDVDAVLRTDFSQGGIEGAARALAKGPLAPRLNDLTDAFLDWRSKTEQAWERRVKHAARAAWALRVAACEWEEARDAAEAMVLLEPDDPEWVARLIEARGRSGHERSAEVAFADYCALLDRRELPDPRVVEIIRVVRSLPGAADRTSAELEPAFVGRQQEILALTRLVSQVLSGSTTLGLILGEAGIGKTRLLQELRRQAHLDGVRCLHARATEFERIVALNPLIDALLDVDLDAHLDALGEPWRTVIGQVLPNNTLDRPVGNPPLIPEENVPRRLFDAFALLFGEIARDQPTVLFIDDLHWADSTSVAILHFFASRMMGSPFGILATVRPEAVGPGDPCAGLLSRESEVVAHRVVMKDLSDDEARSLIDDVMGTPTPEDDVAALLHVAGRHPLYLVEVTRDHRDRAPALSLDLHRPANILPMSLREILSARTRRLSEDGRTVAALLAIGAGSMRLGELASLTNLPIDRVVTLAEELQLARIAGCERDRLWIAHDLFRNALYADLSAPRRAMLHRRMALYLVEQQDRSPDELATHFDKAGERPAAAKYGWMAGDRYLEQGTVAEAAHFFELTARNDIDLSRVARATAKQGISLHLNRDMSRARPVLDVAAKRLRDAGLPRLARRIDIRRVGSLAEEGDAQAADILGGLNEIKAEARKMKDWEALALAIDAELQLLLLDEQLQAAERSTDELQGLVGIGGEETQSAVKSALAVGLSLTSTKRAGIAAEQALLATSERDPRRLTVLNRLLMTLVLQGRFLNHESVPLVAEAAHLAKKSGDLQQRFSFENNRALAYMDADLLAEAEAGFDRAADLLGQADMTFARANLACNQGTLAIAREAYGEAIDHFQRAAGLRGPSAPKYVTDAVNAGLGISALERGSLSDALRRQSALHPAPSIWYYDPSLTVSLRSRILQRRGEHEEAVRLLDRVASEVDGRLVAAWIKLRLSQVILMKRIGHADALDFAKEALAVAEECGLPQRAKTLRAVISTLHQ